MRFLEFIKTPSTTTTVKLVESDRIRVGMSSYDVDYNDHGGRITMDVTQQGMTVAELVYEGDEIVWIHVEPWFRKQGLAQAMLDYLRGRGLKVQMPDARTQDGKGFFSAMSQRGKLDEIEDIGTLDDTDNAHEASTMVVPPGSKPLTTFTVGSMQVVLHLTVSREFAFTVNDKVEGFASYSTGTKDQIGKWIEVGHIWLSPMIRHKGLGKQFYKFLLDQQNYAIISDDYQSEAAQTVWMRLVDEYEAAILHDGVYVEPLTRFEQFDSAYYTTDGEGNELDYSITIAVFPRKRTTPLQESLTEDDGEFDWSKPTTLYRGVVDPAHAEKPFSGTRLGVPTFTDNWHIADVYATSPNNRADAGKSDQVYAYRLNIQKPIHLNEGREDVTEANNILPKLGITNVDQAWAAFRKLYAAMEQARENTWRCNGETFLTDETPPYRIEGIDNGKGFAFPDREYTNLKEIFYEHWQHNWPGLYCTSFNLANSTTFQQMCRDAGFDGIVMYGYNQGPDYEDDDDIFTGTSYDGTTVMEWRALYPEQIEFLGPAGDPRSQSMTESPSLTKAVPFKVNSVNDKEVEYVFIQAGTEYLVQFSRHFNNGDAVSEFITFDAGKQTPTDNWSVGMTQSDWGGRTLQYLSRCT